MPSQTEKRRSFVSKQEPKRTRPWRPFSRERGRFPAKGGFFLFRRSGNDLQVAHPRREVCFPIYVWVPQGNRSMKGPTMAGDPHYQLWSLSLRTGRRGSVRGTSAPMWRVRRTAMFGHFSLGGVFRAAFRVRSGLFEFSGPARAAQPGGTVGWAVLRWGSCGRARPPAGQLPATQGTDRHRETRSGGGSGAGSARSRRPLRESGG